MQQIVILGGGAAGMAAALAASVWLKLNVIWILLFCGAVGVVSTLWTRARGGKKA